MDSNWNGNIKYLVVTHFLLRFYFQEKLLLHIVINIALEKTIDNRIQKKEGCEYIQSGKQITSLPIIFLLYCNFVLFISIIPFSISYKNTVDLLSG